MCRLPGVYFSCQMGLIEEARYSPLAFLYPRNIHWIPAEHIKLIILENIVASSDQRRRVWLWLSVKSKNKRMETEVKLRKTTSPPSKTLVCAVDLAGTHSTPSPTPWLQSLLCAAALQHLQNSFSDQSLWGSQRNWQKSKSDHCKTKYSRTRVRRTSWAGLKILSQ